MTDIVKGFEPSRHFCDFHLAGFTYHDGLDVISELTLGAPVSLKAEPNNIHDPEAVAVFYGDTKIGYVPQGKNKSLFQLIYFGYGDILEAQIQMAKLDTHPERQFRVLVRLKDGRKK